MRFGALTGVAMVNAKVKVKVISGAPSSDVIDNS